MTSTLASDLTTITITTTYDNPGGGPVSAAFTGVRDVWGNTFQLTTLMVAFALINSLLKDELGGGVALRTIIVLVCGTAVLIILLQIVEGIR